MLTEYFCLKKNEYKLSQIEVELFCRMFPGIFIVDRFLFVVIAAGLLLINVHFI